ncbi:hypothetical protein [Mesorhizobium sp. J428]|uniref:hypothetical protein n=1 Tax=Mesorhizobium sp. J428 TaxID=2898440 RepID=UPI002150D010|nr:hypothetical protein [Mesorhizobium sp. J428]MCR5858893.1 hypothetical protein [Mesorhizobium sp. J428]
MSSSDFREIAIRGEEGKAERLFRASVSAFCALTRPTRQNAVQLDDLTLPLYDQVSAEARRYVAAALSECRPAPAGLVRRLAAEPLEISAPILMRSRALKDVDLIGLIARHGIGHARAIANRASLNPAIARLIRALEAASAAQAAVDAEPNQPPSLEEEIVLSPSAETAIPRPSGAAEGARARLRAMMAVGGEAKPTLSDPEAQPAPTGYGKLRDTALTGVPALFQTALADTADIAYTQARPLSQRALRRSLVLVLRGLGLSVEQAFLVVSAIDPNAHPHAEAIRLFVEHYNLIHVEAGRDEIRRLKAESVAALVRRQADAEAVAGEARLLRAS